jgi:hypothetical protein
VELLKSHSCQTPEERLQKEAEDEAEAERVALSSQLESLLQEHSGAEEKNNANGNSGIMGEIIIYVTQEGQDEPTQVCLVIHHREVNSVYLMHLLHKKNGKFYSSLESTFFVVFCLWS